MHISRLCLFQVVEDAPLGLPGGFIPYRLSPDSFSEVNSAAEEAMIGVLCGWVDELVQSGQVKTLCMFGRNSGFIGLALQHRFGRCLRLQRAVGSRESGKPPGLPGCLEHSCGLFWLAEVSSASTHTRIAQSLWLMQKQAWR